MPATASLIDLSRRAPSLRRDSDPGDLSPDSAEPKVLGAPEDWVFPEDRQPGLGEVGAEFFLGDGPRAIGLGAGTDFVEHTESNGRAWLRSALLLSLCLHTLLVVVLLTSARHTPPLLAPDLPQPLRIGLRESNPLRSVLSENAVNPPAEREAPASEETPAEDRLIESLMIESLMVESLVIKSLAVESLESPVVESQTTKPSPPNSTFPELSTVTAPVSETPDPEFVPPALPLQEGAQSRNRQVLSVSDSPLESARIAPSAEVVRDALSRSSLSEPRHWQRPCTERQRRSATLDCEQEEDEARFSALEVNATYRALQTVRTQTRSTRALPAVAENSAGLRQALERQGIPAQAAATDRRAGFGVYLLEELEAGISLGSAEGDRNRQQMKRVTDTTAAAMMVDRIVNDPWIRNATLVRQSRRVVD